MMVLGLHLTSIAPLLEELTLVRLFAEMKSKSEVFQILVVFFEHQMCKR